MSAQVDDRVADELPRSMEGDVAAALDLVDLDASRRERGARNDQMLFLRRASKGHNRWVLDEQQEVLRELTPDSSPRELTLEV